MDKEVWRNIRGLPPNRNYEISNLGNIRNSLTKNIVKTSITNSGYERVILGGKYENKVVWRYIHRLVAQEFIELIGKKLDINHKDGNKLNNNIKNLEICTRSYNLKHAYKELGRKVHNISLTKKQAEQIRKEIKDSGKSQRQIADDHNVSPMVVSRIRHFIQTEYK